MLIKRWTLKCRLRTIAFRETPYHGLSFFIYHTSVCSSQAKSRSVIHDTYPDVWHPRLGGTTQTGFNIQYIPQYIHTVSFRCENYFIPCGFVLFMHLSAMSKLRNIFVCHSYLITNKHDVPLPGPRLLHRLENGGNVNCSLSCRIRMWFVVVCFVVVALCFWWTYMSAHPYS